MPPCAIRSTSRYFPKGVGSTGPGILAPGRFLPCFIPERGRTVGQKAPVDRGLTRMTRVVNAVMVTTVLGALSGCADPLDTSHTIDPYTSFGGIIYREG